jgi:hypothetical protein
MSERSFEQSPEPLPYATPSPLASHGDLFRDGPLLVARDGIMLDPVCILCGEAADTPALHLRFTWDSSFKRTTGSTLELRRAGSIHARLCPRHLGRWKSGRLTGLIGMIASGLLMLAAIVVAVINESSDIPRYTPHAIGVLLVGFAIFIGFLFLFTLRTRTVKCCRIEQGYLYLEGVHEAFLERLPDLPELPVKPVDA